LLVVQVKERLTGAIILVALIVLLVPELLTGPVRSAPRSAAVASSIEEPPLRSYTIKLAEEPRMRGASMHGAPEQPTPLPPAPAAVSSPSAAPSAGTSAPAPANVPAAAPPEHRPAAPPAGAVSPAGSADTSGAYMVQLGGFASRANAERLAKQVRSQGFTVSVSQGSSGHLYRVRVGPVRDRAAAGELAQQLRAHGHGGGTIVPK
jgi:cell division septation protein DedD